MGLSDEERLARQFPRIPVFSAASLAGQKAAATGFCFYTWPCSRLYVQAVAGIAVLPRTGFLPSDGQLFPNPVMEE
jgi:hypothetical protein